MFLLWRVRILYASLLCICTILIIYGKTINFGFNLDDKLATSIHPSVKKGLKGIPEIFTSPYMDINEPRYGGYRPMAKFSYALEYAIWGENTKASHIINLLIYLLCCILFYNLLKIQFADWHWLLHLCALLFFAVHPLHVEAVASLKNRETLFAFFWGCLSAYILLKDQNLLSVMLAILFFLIAVMSKLEAVFFPVYTAYYLWFADKWSSKKSIIYGILLPVFGVALYLSIQSTFQYPLVFDIYDYENSIVGHQYSLSHFATVAYILAYNLKLIFLPSKYMFFYGVTEIGLMNWKNAIVWLSTLVHFLLLALMIYGSVKRHKYALLIFFYFFSIGLYMNLLQLIPGMVGDRLLFTTVGFGAIVVSYFIHHFFKRFDKKFVYLLVPLISVWFLFLSLKSTNRVNCWEDTLTLGNCDIEHLQNNYIANIIYLSFIETELKNPNSTYDKNELVETTIKYANQALALKANSIEARVHLGYVYCNELDLIEKGGEYLFDAMKIKPTHMKTLFNLGLCFEKKGELSKAVKFYDAANQQNKYNIELKSKLAISYCKINDLILCKSVIDEMLVSHKNHYKTYLTEGNYYLFKKDTLQATLSYEKALYYNPDLLELKEMIAQYYLSENNIEKYDQFK